MQPIFAKRKGRRIGREAEEDAAGDQDDQGMQHKPQSLLSKLTICGISRLTESSGSAAVRPKIVSRNVSKTKKKIDFGGTSMNDDEDDGNSPAVFVPRKTNLSRQAVERNAGRKSQINFAADRLPSRPDVERASYSADILSELKASTPSLPQDLRNKSDVITIDDDEGKELDLAAKFGTDFRIEGTGAIPTTTEIKEKKERRARLAKEQEFISLDTEGEDDEQGEDDSAESSEHETSILPYTGISKRKKEGPSRIAEDEDEFGEGFDEFVTDGQIALGKKSERKLRAQQKEKMRDMITEAQDEESESGNDEEEVERRQVYEAAQTRKGMDGLKKVGEGDVRPKRPRTPPRIAPLPTLGGVMEGLKERKQARELERKVGAQRLEGVRRELRDIEVRKGEVQRLMTEAGERFEKLREEVEKERGAADGGEVVLVERGGSGMGNGMQGRGLESLGSA